jgi:hypothetical protein
MERQIAEELMVALNDLSFELAKISEITQKIKDNEDRVRFRLGLANIIGDLYTELMIPVLRQYPDLDPDKNSSS